LYPSGLAATSPGGGNKLSLFEKREYGEAGREFVKRRSWSTERPCHETVRGINIVISTSGENSK